MQHVWNRGCLLCVGEGGGWGVERRGWSILPSIYIFLSFFSFLVPLSE